MSIHFCPLLGSFGIPSTSNEVDLMLMYLFTAEIKVALVSYLFPASLFFSSGNKLKSQGTRSLLYGG